MLDFNDDNARSHVYKKVKLWKDENVPLNMITLLISHDINTIELVWKYLKDYVEIKRLKTQENLKSAMRNGGDSVDQKIIDNCINHVHAILNEIFESNGEFT